MPSTPCCYERAFLRPVLAKYGGATQDRMRKYTDRATWPYARLMMQRAEQISQTAIPVFISGPSQ